jgi:DNA-binding PadR family transcriptional regulator
LSAENAALRKQLESIQQEEKDQERNARREAFRVLERNKLVTHVRKKPDDWGKDINSTLLEIFKAIAPGLLAENHTTNMANEVAFHISRSTDYLHHWPVPSNHFAGWLSDLHAMDLIEPSRKRHPVSDTKEYWSLTEFGRAVFNELRRMQLEIATSPALEAPPQAADG